MPKRVDKLIKSIRMFTENEESGLFEGLQDEEFLQAINDALHRLQSIIIAKHNRTFLKEITMDVIPNQREYEMPPDAFLGSKVFNVEYSEDGIEEDFYKLDKTSIHLKSNQGSTPYGYFTRDEKIILSPIPDTAAKLRIAYQKRIDELDIRRGVVQGAVLSSTDRTVTTLILDVANAITVLDADEIEDADYICIVDRRGRIKMRNIPVNSIDTSTGIVTIEAGFIYNEGETITSGDFIVCGMDTTTHPLEFPRTVIRYIITYGKWYILRRDSSVDFAETQAELLEMERDILDSYAEDDQDIIYIPHIYGTESDGMW